MRCTKGAVRAAERERVTNDGPFAVLFRNADCYDDHESQSLLSPYSAICSVLQGRDKRGIYDVDGACIRERDIDVEIILSFREASLRFSRQHKYSITSAFPSRSAASWLCWAPISSREVLENPISLGPELTDVKGESCRGVLAPAADASLQKHFKKQNSYLLIRSFAENGPSKFKLIFKRVCLSLSCRQTHVSVI